MGKNPKYKSHTAVTVKGLRNELNRERWDRKGVPVKARCGDQEFIVTGIWNADAALVLDITPDGKGQ